MNRGLSLQAIPEPCSLLQSIASKKIAVEMLRCLPGWPRFRADADKDCNHAFIGDFESPYRDLDDAVVQLIAEHPGIENRYCFLGHRFEWLQWILERCATAEEIDIASTAIKGESRVFPLGIDPQDDSVFWTTADTCKRVSFWLSSIEDSSLLANLDPAAMLKGNLYGWKPVTNIAARLARIRSDFHSLMKFYLDVSSCKEAVLVVVD